MKLLSNLRAEDIKGKRVLLRADLNVPVEQGIVKDPFRIQRVLKTVAYLKDAGAKVIICAHIGRKPEETLAPVATAIQRSIPLTFVRSVTGPEVSVCITAMKDGDVLLLENLRTDEREKENDTDFARLLASYADLYINDAFSASHRSHASIVGVPHYIPGYAGLLLEEECEHLEKALSPQTPSLAILGGAKFETKEPLIKRLLETYDHLFLAGALVNDAYKGKGFEVGRSLVSGFLPDAQVLNHPKLILPPDALVQLPDGQARVRSAQAVRPEEKIVDIGPDSFALLLPYIKEAHFILWNGPTGLYEAGYDDWTNAIASAIAEANTCSIVGGGDTLASITRNGLEEQFTFVSTAGGAMLEFLLNGNLPGLKALS